MFIVLEEHQRSFWHSSLSMPLLLIELCRCTLLDLLFMSCVLACSSCSWWFWVCLWTPFCTTIRTVINNLKSTSEVDFSSFWSSASEVWFWVCFWTPFWSFWTQLLKMIMGSLLNVLLKLLNTASEDDYGFASERPSEASEHSLWRWFWVRFWTPFWSFWT